MQGAHAAGPERSLQRQRVCHRRAVCRSMNEFRKALDAHVAGKLDLSDVEREIHLALARKPELAAAHGALVEALYRGGRIKGETYLALINVIRTFLKTQPRVEVRVVPPAAAAPPSAGTEDKTQFRAPKPAAPSAPAASAPAPAAEGEKTQFRPPRAASAGAAANAPAASASA